MPRHKGQTKRTATVDRLITGAIKIGASYRDAARAAGISEDTLARWRTKDAEFAEMLTRAEAEGKVGWLAKIEQAANAGDWRAVAWKLERRYPQEWGKVDRLEVTLKQQVDAIAAELALAPDEAAALHADIDQFLAGVRKR